MKKLVKLVSLVAVLVAASIMLSACGGSVVGTWAFQSFEATGTIMGMDMNVSFDIDNITSENEEMWEFFIDLTFEFSEDGTVVSAMSDGESAKYEMDGSKVIFLDDEGNPEDMDGFTLEVVKGQLVMSGESEGLTIKVVFKKA